MKGVGEPSMNERMASVFTGMLILFGAIVAMLTWWQVFEAPDLKAKSSNNQRTLYEQRIARGVIRTADGVVLARNVGARSGNGDEVYRRRYPQRGLASHVVGYATAQRTHTGLERSFNDYLSGSTHELAGFLGQLDGSAVIRGDDVSLTIDSRVQRAAVDALGSRRGAVVAIQPRTGRILALVSTPGYDPNQLLRRYGRVASAPGAPLFNRATSGLYPPGSTFKVVTAAAALEDGVLPETSFEGGSTYKVPGAPPVSNFAGESFGRHDLATALTYSINTTFARLGVQLGQGKLRDVSERFGFYADPPLDDLPGGERMPSGLYGPGRRLLGTDEGVDVAREAIGQERLSVTPLQMALVASAIANDGVMMHPFLVDSARDERGRIEYRARPRRERRVLTPAVADELRTMMSDVVREGTGTAAAVSGIDIAGKTGTADTPSGNVVWFICFAPAQRTEIAVAVAIEGQPPGATGGVVAAPVAKAVIEAALGAQRRS